MRRTLMKSKIHRAIVTGAHLDYDGSITIDATLMQQAGLLPHERVQVLDCDNGVRLETYVIEGEPDSGTVSVNGPAARLVQPGDRVIIVSYGDYDEAEARAHTPTVVLVDDRNRFRPAAGTAGAVA